MPGFLKRLFSRKGGKDRTDDPGDDDARTGEADVFAGLDVAAIEAEAERAREAGETGAEAETGEEGDRPEAEKAEEMESAVNAETSEDVHEDEERIERDGGAPPPDEPDEPDAPEEESREYAPGEFPDLSKIPAIAKIDFSGLPDPAEVHKEMRAASGKRRSVHEEDEDDAERGVKPGRRKIAAAAAILLLVGLGGGGAWMLFAPTPLPEDAPVEAHAPEPDAPPPETLPDAPLATAPARPLETVADPERSGFKVSLPMPPRVRPDDRAPAREALLTPPEIAPQIEPVLEPETALAPPADAPEARPDPDARPTETAETVDQDEAPVETATVEDDRLPAVMDRDALPRLLEPEQPSPPARGQDAPPRPTFAALPALEPATALADAPLRSLQESTRRGRLPIIGEDGRAPWQVYARPFQPDVARIPVAVVVHGLGLDVDATEAAISRLPAAVTLSFNPYAEDVAGWMRRARQAGHEVTLDLPLEPLNFPVRDPGPFGLLTMLSPAENRDRLHTLMARAPSAVGMVVPHASPFLASADDMRHVLTQFRDRGLLLVDDGTGATLARRLGIDVPTVSYALRIDERPFREAIDARLHYAEAVAERHGKVAVLAQPRPVTFERLTRWLDDIGRRGFVLAPVSALVEHREGTS